MNATERVFWGVTVGAILLFMCVADLAGDRANPDDISAIAVLLGSVVIGGAFAWGAHMWPKEDKGMGFEHES